VTDKVVDASAIVALLFNELAHETVVPRLRGASLRAAPSLLEFEVASACLKKIRATPNERQALLAAFALLPELSITLETIDLGEAIALAKRTKLSFYDRSAADGWRGACGKKKRAGATTPGYVQRETEVNGDTCIFNGEI
jgi:predicted nucleic acid-binding protein